MSKKEEKFCPREEKGDWGSGRRASQSWAHKISLLPKWLENVVMVKKRMSSGACVSSLLTLIELVPKIVSLCLPLSFMNTFFLYHHILMHPWDEEHTTFITGKGMYCYKPMPFGLKNFGVTYQRLVSKMFKEEIREIVECYMDDMIVKSRKSLSHVADLSQIFTKVRKYKMMLNQAKCVFGVR